MCGLFDGADYSHINGKLRDPGKSYLVNIKIVVFLRNYCIYPNICLSVCSNANPLHYYALRVPHKMDRWRLLEKVEVRVTVSVTVCVV